MPVRLALLSRLVDGVTRWLRAPVDPATFSWFRRLFLGKFLLFDLLSLGKAAAPSTGNLLSACVAGACLALSETRHGLRFAAATVLLIKLLEIAASFPSTINHAFFDAALLFALACGPHRENGPGLHPLRVAQAGIMLVFFYSGMQKLVHGYYVNGQFLALRVLYHEGDLGRRLRWILSSTGRLLELPLPPTGAQSRPNGLVETTVGLPAWSRSVLCVISNGAWMAEMGLPILALRRALRRWAVRGLLALEAAILVLTGEISFGFTVVACLLSFFPRSARWSYPTSFAILSVAAVAREVGH